MIPPAISYAVFRDGQLIAKHTGNVLARHPRKGIDMSTLQEIHPEMFDGFPERRAFAEVLSNKAAAAKGFATAAFSKAKGAVSAAIHYVIDSGPFAWCRGAFSTLMSFAGRQAARLGKTGVVATTTTVLTSEKGQQAIGKTLGFVARVADSVVRAAASVIGIIPVIGKPVSNAINSARHWTWNSALDLSLTMKANGIVKAFSHEGVVSRNVRRFVLPFTAYKLISTFVPGFWKIPVYGAVIGYGAVKAMNESVFIGNVYQRVAKAMRTEITPVVTTEPAKKISLAKIPPVVDPVTEVVADAVADAVVEAATEVVTEEATKAAVETGPQLAGNAAHVAADVATDIAVENHMTTNYVKSAKDKREKDIAMVVRATLTWSVDPATAWTECGKDEGKAIIKSLKACVLPKFMEVCGPKVPGGSRAKAESKAYSYARLMVAAFLDDQGELRPDQVPLKYSEAMEEVLIDGASEILWTIFEQAAPLPVANSTVAA